jgi:glycosyltransferase involved in cell wall biosynthesis
MNISIAMATYNGEKYIKEQLQSLSNQTSLPFELVVGDDGSTDATLDILKEF